MKQHPRAPPEEPSAPEPKGLSLLKKTVTQLVQQFKAEHTGEDSPYIVVGRHHRKFSSKD